jgi:hypothetical protein
MPRPKNVVPQREYTKRVNGCILVLFKESIGALYPHLPAPIDLTSDELNSSNPGWVWVGFVFVVVVFMFFIQR